ncbi:fimbria/pilus outer membrane usher protein [Frateuria soli]|uniref:fimbria/pilus outer membrane usher protein n=1 Tax=Frateuria soli TaxID=1542730 RepID=UPI001E51C083|nr:fimbria/pilus outer membrane usher protein [Frateuria soli]UGB38296.1 fimbrial biogenesis outer membrane usher protein [Frateuria soli]
MSASANAGGSADVATPLADTAAPANYADFDPALLSGAGQNTTDLSRFEHGNPVLPGLYSTDVYLNNAWKGRANVRFAAARPDANATLCVDDRLLGQLGLLPAEPDPALAARLRDKTACVAIGEAIVGATATFEMASLRLDISVPQAYMNQLPRGYVSPEYWDEGIPAALLNYSLNSYRTRSQGQAQTSSYLGLNAGLNLGGWHFRQDSTAVWQSATGNMSARHRWQTINAYVERDLPALRARVTLGDSYTDGSVFDSFGLRGVQLRTDDRMLPQSMRGYAPVVRGVAQTNAKVTVSQNGVQIYQTTVAPGPFTVKDLYPTGYGGDLTVAVTEADGRVRTFAVPYASVSQLLRPGITRFDLAAGRLRNLSLTDAPDVVQATVQHGFNNLVTGYAGVGGFEGYAALLLGGAVNTRAGAFALDLTSARTRIPDAGAHAGTSVRLSYSKLVPDTQTVLSVAAYRYSTSGFLGLTDAALARDYALHGLDPFQATSKRTTVIDGVPRQSLLTPSEQAALSGGDFDPSRARLAGLARQRNSFTLTLTQRLGDGAGSLYVTGLARDYWNQAGTDTQLQLGYNNRYGRLSYSVSATRVQNSEAGSDTQFMLSLSLPLGGGDQVPTLTFNASQSRELGHQDQAVLNGSLGEDGTFTYGGSITRVGGGGGTAETLNAGYRAGYGSLDASYGRGNGYSQASVSAAGAVVVHAGGVTFGQLMGDTVGLVYAPGAAGAKVTSASGVYVDRHGYALLPYLVPYSLNTVQLDPKGLPLDVQLKATSAQVAPHAGALSQVTFGTERGRTVILQARRPDGQALPFGAQVFNPQDVSLGVVGQGGKILARGVEASGELTARWQDDRGRPQACTLHYTLPQEVGDGDAAYTAIPTICTAPAVSRQDR